MCQSLRLTTGKLAALQSFHVRFAHSSGQSIVVDQYIVLKINNDVNSFVFLVEKELKQFLDNEIKSEEQTSDKSQLPKTFEGFKVNADGSEIELVKDTPDET